MSNNLDANVLLRQALACERAGKIDEAIALFSRVVDRYPNTDAAQSAQSYLAGTEPKPAAAAVHGPWTGAAFPDAAVIQRVTVVDIDISFGQLVALVVKGTLAMLFVSLFLGVLGAIAFVVIGQMLATR